jgi:pimeloyl-ACP methyl ester carboxylesterase
MWKRARGLKALVHDAVDFTVDLVEEGHESTARMAMRLLRLAPPLVAPAQLIDDLRRATTALNLDSIRAVNRAIERLTNAGLDAALVAQLLPLAETSGGAPVPMRSDAVGSAGWLSDAAIGALNGIVGDYLHQQGNGLDLGLSLRRGDALHPVDGPDAPEIASRSVAVFVHGLAATEWSWCWDAAVYHGDAATSFGTLLERDLGLSALFARYNSGRRVSDNARLLARALERLVEHNPSIEEIVLVGHSMGGLVARCACHLAREERWLGKVTRVVSLGAPHQGAPLAKLGHLVPTILGHIDHPGTRIPAAILARQSAGIRDLRRGVVLDDAWNRSPESAAKEVPLVDSIAYAFVAATVTRDPAHPLGQLLGDALVRIPSASGTTERSRTFGIETRCFGGIVHHQLQNHPDVYAFLLESCRQGRSARRG